jgi:hypothetical protein
MFIEERRFFLERFLKQVLNIVHFAGSEEYKAFVRPQTSDVERSLALLPKLQSDDVLKRICEVHPVNTNMDPMQVKRYHDVISEFSANSKKLFGFLKVSVQ